MSDAPPPSGAEQAPGGVLLSFAHRPRLFIGAALMVVAYLLVLPTSLREATRLLIAWNVGAWAFLLLIAMMIGNRKANIRKQAHVEDENQWTLLLVGLLAGGASLAAIVWELGPVKGMEGWEKTAHVALVIASVLSSWTFINTMFALHYAGVYFGRTHGKMRAGLVFPDTEQPGWIEFVYQAFTVGCTFASSDVNVTSARMRRIVAIQGVVSFFYNTVVLALAINIAAGFF